MGTPQTNPSKNGKPADAPPTPEVAAPTAQAALEVPAQTAMVRVGFDTVQGFEGLQRICKAFAQSSLVPETYRGNLANCMIAFEMAARMGASPLMVMQNLYIVHGNPSWASKFLIASFNQCGRFSAIRYRWTGEKGKANWGCIAWATEKATGEIVESPEVTWLMVKSEGWADKKGSKWMTLPELMFMYRSATFLVRTTAPELTMGLQTAEEAIDVGPQAPEADAPKGVDALSKIVQARKATVETTTATDAGEPPHDPNTGEILEQQPVGDGPPTDEPPPGDTERIDPTAPKAEAKPAAAEAAKK